MRDWKHDSGGYFFLGGACTKALFFILLQILFSFGTAPDKYGSSDVLYIFSCTG